MAWTFVNSNGASASGSASTITVAVTGCNAGDVAFICLKHEGTVATTPTISDGNSSTFTREITEQGVSSAEPWMSAFWGVLNAGGTITFTGNYNATKTFRDIAVIVYTPPGGASLARDGSAVSQGHAAAASVTSTNFTTTGTDGIAVGTYGSFGDDISSMQINGGAADRTQKASATNSAIWTRAYSAGFTGASTGTTAGANAWDAGGFAVNATVSGGGGGGVDAPGRPDHKRRQRPAQFTPMCDGFRPAKFGGWR